MSIHFNKPVSLVERKKLQWAQEREELAGLSAPWGIVSYSSTNTSSDEVTKLGTSTASAEIFARRASNSSRRPSLPPIYNSNTNSKKNYSYNQNEKYDKEFGGETSGYGSDNPNNTPEHYQQSTWNQNLGCELSLSNRDDRSKWREKAAEQINKFWDPNDYHKMEDAPSWVKRGLQEGTELIVSNTSPAESPEQDYMDQNRPYTSSSVSQTRTYIRGQNSQIDPVELAQREIKRQLARAHQEAIKQQLEEREKRRREEKERQIKEEREEELRIEKEQEIDRKRREREQHMMLEKQERERKRNKAIQEALELAEKDAQQRKVKQKLVRQSSLNFSENVFEKEKLISPRPIGIIEEMKNNAVSKNGTIKEENNIQVDNKLINSTAAPNDINFVNNNVCNNSQSNYNNEKKENNLNRQEQVNAQIIHDFPQSKKKENNIENITRNIQTPFDNYPGIPFAILMPAFTPSTSQPIPISTMPVPSGAEIAPTSRTENRVLTPTIYRNRRFCDSSTQTDYISSSAKSESEQSKDYKNIRDKITNLDINEDSKSKCKSSERARENSSDRPKWGANRPPTRYVKQSEKDPFYQRKKSRQKIRQIKMYEDKNNNYSPHSSDDSQIVSPRVYRRKGFIEKRRTRALWQKNGQVFAKNIQVYQTELVPLESDNNQIKYKKINNCAKCCCDCRSNKHKYTEEVKVIDILKIEHTPRDKTKLKEDENSLPDCNSSSVDGEVLEKLNSLHDGLMMKQEKWRHSPSTPSLSSPSRVTELNR